MAQAAEVSDLGFTAVVLDSSVVIKWFREGEVLREQALLLRQAYLEGRLRLAVPDLLFYEIANVLRYKRGWSCEQVQAAVQSLFDMKIERMALTPELLGRAVEVAYLYDVTVYDAVFIACAEQLNALMITADEELTEARGGPSIVRFLGSISKTSGRP